MKHLLVLLAALLIACTPDPSIEPEPVRTAHLGAMTLQARTVPLIWHPVEGWNVDPLFGAAERDSACGTPEPDLHPLAIELDAETLPTGALVTGATLVIDPCDDRGAAMPDNFPVFALFAIDRWGTPTQTASAAQDQSADVVAYSKPHEIVMQMFPGPVRINREKHRYMVLFEPEHGLEATGGTRVTGLVLDLAVP